MGIGPWIRRMFGPYERQVSDAYRALFFDIGDFLDRVRAWKPTARRVLEVGCGEGAVTERLNAAYPDAEITAIDITPRIGRLYRGPSRGVRFVHCGVQDIAATEQDNMIWWCSATSCTTFPPNTARICLMPSGQPWPREGYSCSRNGSALIR